MQECDGCGEMHPVTEESKLAKKLLSIAAQSDCNIGEIFTAFADAMLNITRISHVGGGIDSEKAVSEDDGKIYEILIQTQPYVENYKAELSLTIRIIDNNKVN